MRTLVTGGVRSGKSHWAEQQLADRGEVHYIAPGYLPDPTTDPEWAERVRRHRDRRPGTWQTIETIHVADALVTATGPVLIDCLGMWLTRQLDEVDAWQTPRDQWQPTIDARIDDLVDAWRSTPVDVIAVTNEVGWTLVPDSPGSRAFVELLGTLNARLGALSDSVILVVAGRSLILSSPGRPPATGGSTC